MLERPPAAREAALCTAAEGRAAHAARFIAFSNSALRNPKAPYAARPSYRPSTPLLWAARRRGP